LTGALLVLLAYGKTFAALTFLVTLYGIESLPGVHLASFSDENHAVDHVSFERLQMMDGWMISRSESAGRWDLSCLLAQ